MHKEPWGFKDWLLIANNVVIIIAAFLSFAGYGFKLYTLPGIQEAQAKTLAEYGERLTNHDQEIAVLSKGIEDIKFMLTNNKQKERIT